MSMENHDGMISTGETRDSSSRALWQSYQQRLSSSPFLAAKQFSSDDEVKTALQHWVTLAADFFDEGIQKLVPRYDSCLNLGGDYVEK
jgi:hypothetical protein